MKNAIYGLVLVWCLAASVYAGPESLPSDKEMKQVAPAPACPDWSGFYVGGFGGYVRSDVDRELSLFGGWGSPPLTTPALNAGSRDLDFDGGEAGGLIGYNFQFNHWVLGVEGTGAHLWARDSFIDSAIPYGPIDFRMSSSFKTDYLATFGGRIGYAFCRWLPYVTGGAAVGNLDYTQVIIFRPVSPGETEAGHGEDTNLGWMVGGGLEYALTKHWSLRADYKYVDLGHTGFRSNFGDGGGAAATQRADLTEHDATFAIVFKF